MIRHPSTEGRDYTERLMQKQSVWWKRAIDVQAPYRWHLLALRPGYTLDIGCGIGRNLEHLRGFGVGIDHNRDSLEVARQKGLTAFLPDEFAESTYNEPERYDSLLLSHVAEHMTLAESTALLAGYVPNLRRDGKLIILTPQEAGFRSDETHVEFMDFSKLRQVHQRLGFAFEKEYSFPFPRFVGVVFTYNEFISISRKLK